LKDPVFIRRIFHLRNNIYIRGCSQNFIKRHV